MTIALPLVLFNRVQEQELLSELVKLERSAEIIAPMPALWLPTPDRFGCSAANFRWGAGVLIPITQPLAGVSQPFFTSRPPKAVISAVPLSQFKSIWVPETR
ncbi:hypothetical protein [Microcoleus sp. herbarium7]|uniref:hypothetical protein n=1 Tax=Microcoleus sp. herbarium7 TaxID=3055435 RepID=UPI002FD6C710